MLRYTTLLVTKGQYQIGSYLFSGQAAIQLLGKNAPK